MPFGFCSLLELFLFSGKSCLKKVTGKKERKEKEERRAESKKEDKGEEKEEKKKLSFGFGWLIQL